MTEIIEYISLNYTWFLIGAIIILLAIIGSYADKINFGQGKNKTDLEKNKDEDSLNLEGKKLADILNHNIDNSINKENIDNNTDESAAITHLEGNESFIKEESHDLNDFEASFDKFDEEFNSLMPKKDVIESDLLDDINNLSLEKTQKFDLRNIPDLDDVELPKIKNLKVEDDDIWKF